MRIRSWTWCLNNSLCTEEESGIWPPYHWFYWPKNWSCKFSCLNASPLFIQINICMCCHHFQSELFLLGTVQSCRHSLGCIWMLTLAWSPAFCYCILLLFCSQPGARLHKEEVPKHHCCPVKPQSSVVAWLVPEPFLFSHLFLEDIFWDQLNSSTARNLLSPFSLFLFTSVPVKNILKIH